MNDLSVYPVEPALAPEGLSATTHRQKPLSELQLNISQAMPEFHLRAQEADYTGDVYRGRLVNLLV